ncbi:hypothetical protein J5N97_001411 [Dioscorea zingiberensis]|uniref:Uncharacterized protein n=1 Tax=Dioscorea zingiberensis TaxID=325984 RepID=A0A9D5BU86_9LILI|nr:hypothetical protein J5N97_001411 [Dioscorea zingiberensis]
MWKCADLKAAVAELEKPWEVVERASTLISVNADEQVKALADWFQKRGRFDMWTEKDRLPYAIVGGEEVDGVEEMKFDDWIARGDNGSRKSLRRASDRHGKGGSKFIKAGVEDSSEQIAGELHKRCLMNAHQDESSAIYVKNKHVD